MKIAVFGATGRTGQQVVQQALEQGFQVVALARTPAKLSLQHAALTVIQGDVKDAGSVERVIAGVDAVISVLGPTSNQPVFEVSQGMQHILNAMSKSGVKRIVLSAGAGVGDPEDAPAFFNKVMNVLLKTMARNVFEDMLKTVALVRASSLDWTIVRVPMLTDDPATGQVRVGMVGKGMGPRISRADMAGYMLKQVQSSEQLRKAPAISN